MITVVVGEDEYSKIEFIKDKFKDCIEIRHPRCKLYNLYQSGIYLQADDIAYLIFNSDLRKVNRVLYSYFLKTINVHRYHGLSKIIIKDHSKDTYIPINELADSDLTLINIILHITYYSGHVLYIKNPENYLYPNKIKVLCELFSTLDNLILDTNSPFILKYLGNANIEYIDSNNSRTLSKGLITFNILC